MTEEARQTLSRAEFEKLVLAHARDDGAFRASLLADPKGTLKKAFEVELPDAVEFTVVEETPSRFYLVLPVESAELSDEELGAVAGGVGSMTASGFGVTSFQMSAAAASGSALTKF